MKHFFISQAGLAFLALSTIVPGFCLAKEDKEPKQSIECKQESFKHNMLMQLADTKGRFVAGTQFWVTLEIIKDGPEVTVAASSC